MVSFFLLKVFVGVLLSCFHSLFQRELVITVLWIFSLSKVLLEFF